MNKYESKLLSQWPRHHSLGMTIFVLWRGILFFTVPFLATFWIFRFFVFHHHAVYWDEIVIFPVIGLVVGVIRGYPSGIIWNGFMEIYRNRVTMWLNLRIGCKLP